MYQINASTAATLREQIMAGHTKEKEVCVAL